MIKVNFSREADQYRAEVKDHSDEIVCAGVSALLQAFVGYAANFAEKIEYQLMPGDSYVECKGGCDISHAFEMLKIGVKQIELGYPGTITMIDTFVKSGS